MTKWLDYCVMCSFASMGMSQAQLLCIHVVICDANSCFLQLQSVLPDRGNWLAQMVSPEVLGLVIVFYCEYLFSVAAALLTAWNTLVLFISFFPSLEAVSSKAAV